MHVMCIEKCVSFSLLLFFFFFAFSKTSTQTHKHKKNNCEWLFVCMSKSRICHWWDGRSFSRSLLSDLFICVFDFMFCFVFFCSFLFFYVKTQFHNDFVFQIRKVRTKYDEKHFILFFVFSQFFFCFPNFADVIGN